jgi:hypothetical protein
MQRVPAARNALLIPTPPPIRKTSLRQLDSGRGRLLRLLLEPVQCQQDLSAAAFFRKQDAVDDPIAVHPDLPDIPVKMTGGPQAPIANLLHARKHSRRIGIGELVDEPFDRTTTRCGLVVAPAPPDRRRLTGGGVGLLPGSLRWSHRASLCSASDRAPLVSRTGPNPGPRRVEKRKTPRVHGAQAYSGTGTRTPNSCSRGRRVANYTIPDRAAKDSGRPAPAGPDTPAGTTPMRPPEGTYASAGRPSGAK